MKAEHCVLSNFTNFYEVKCVKPRTSCLLIKHATKNDIDSRYDTGYISGPTTNIQILVVGTLHKTAQVRVEPWQQPTARSSSAKTRQRMEKKERGMSTMIQILNAAVLLEPRAVNALFNQSRDIRKDCR